MDTVYIFFKIGEKIFVRVYKNGNEKWKDRVILSRIGNMMHKVKEKNGNTKVIGVS